MGQERTLVLVEGDAMEKVSFSDGIGIAGIILAVILLVLDKAGKLKGGLLIALLCLAGAMTLFLAVGNSFVLDAPTKWRVWRGLLMCSLVAFTYSGLAIWISGGTLQEASDLTAIKPSVILKPFVGPLDPYPDNTNVGGVIWHSFYVDVRLDVVNGHTDIGDVDFLVRLDNSIAGIGQISQFPGVTAFPANDTPSFCLQGTNEAGAPESLPIVPKPGTMQTAPIYRVHCEKMLANTTIHLVVASVALNPPLAPGHLPDSLFAPRRAPKRIQAKGTYVVGGEKYPLELLYEFPAS